MNTTENNKLIAEFMGVKTLTVDELKSILKTNRENGLIHTPQAEVVEDLKYHSSWDWLMTVQKKISEIYNKNAQRLCFEKGDLFDNMEVYLFNVQIEEHYKAVVEFIKWYNENKED